MPFWIFMFLMNLAIPVTMIFFGSRFLTHPPENINSAFGYRTARSMKNRETWDFAHHSCGKLWRVTGWVILAPSAIATLSTLGRGMGEIGKASLFVSLVQLEILLCSMGPVERALKKNFDENGNRKASQKSL